VQRIERVSADLVSIGRANMVVVRIEASDGAYGLGETIVGADARAIEDIAEKLYRDSFWVGGPLHAASRSGIDIALWDLKGRTLGVPVHELLGGPSRSRIPAYCHCPAGAAPEEFAAGLRAVRERGFRAAKTTLPLFYGSASGSGSGSVAYSGAKGAIDGSLKETEHVPTATFDRIAEFFAAGREAVGPDFELMLDCHGRLSPTNAIRLGHALEPFGLLFLEEPIPPESATELARVRAAVKVPIAAGERLASLYEVRPFLEAGALDFLQCDVITCGGITGARKIAALAEAYYVPFAPHNPNGPIATAASAQLLASIPNASVLESVGSADDEARFAAIVDGALVAQEGEIAVPTAPGLGVELRPDALERFPAEPRRATR
jgi:galactonate dehydratase